MEIWPDLFGGALLVRQYVGLESHGELRPLECFASLFSRRANAR
jgi:hypothetical protein